MLFARRDSGANWPAEYLRRSHADEEPSVEAGITGQAGFAACFPIEVHVSSDYTPRRGLN
jgi:hypothetical protein